MKLKSLLFGSAAVLAAGTGAQAADLPTAEPVEYVRICDAFGEGFYYIPGTDTCLKVGGRVRIEAHYVDGNDAYYFINGTGEDNFNNFTTRARGYVRLDARQQTDLGLVRAYVSLQMTVGPADSSDPNGVGGANYSSTDPAIDQAFIQLSNDMGTFTAGHASSFFDAPFSSNTFGTRVGIDDPTTEQTLFAFTFGGGNGFSATLSIEDPASSGRRGEGFFFGDVSDDYEGQEVPDIVANVRIDQGWGSAMIAGVLHQIHDLDDDGLGWAVNGGVNVAIPGTMFGFGLTAGYADGAIRYITNDPGHVGDFGLPPGVGDDDGPTDGGDGNTAWQIRGGVSAQFTETLGAYLDASWTSVDQDQDTDTDLSYDAWAVAADLQWKPVPGLVMGPEIAYSQLSYDDFDFDDFDDDDDDDDDDGDPSVWSAMFRIQKDF